MIAHCSSRLGTATKQFLHLGDIEMLLSQAALACQYLIRTQWGVNP